jgi:hypothetical protein
VANAESYRNSIRELAGEKAVTEVSIAKDIDDAIDEYINFCALLPAIHLLSAALTHRQSV